MSVKVVLDESKYGNTGVDDMPLYAFYRVKKNGNEEFITDRNCDGITLIAVTKEQFNQWKNHNWVAREVK